MARAISFNRKTINTALAWAIGLLIFFPILWTILTSFKTEGQAIAFEIERTSDRALASQATTEMNFDPNDPDHLCAALCAGKRRSPIPDIHPPSHRAHT